MIEIYFEIGHIKAEKENGCIQIFDESKKSEIWMTPYQLKKLSAALT